MTDVISTDHPLTASQRTVLSALLDTLLPASADGAMPSAADVGFDAYLVTQAEGFIPELTLALQQFESSFAGLPIAERCERVAAFSTASPALFATLLTRVYDCYYQDDRARTQIGVVTGAPFPQGNTIAAGDLSLLDPVIANSARHGYRRPFAPSSQRTRYIGPITDTGRWEHFRHRPDDIFICTPPKCGTTWTQAIVCMLVFGRADHGQKPGVISPWIDANFAPIEDYLGMVDAQTHRRFIKTHSPFDGIPYFPECSYLVVCRDPRDMYFSMLNHRDNMNNRDVAFKVFPSGEDAFRNWVNGPFSKDDFDIQSLAGTCRFLQTYWQYRDLPNVHLYHYTDMKADLRGHIRRVADAIQVPVTDAQLDSMTEAASFEFMQKNGDQFAPMAGHDFWKADSGFFATGRNAQWRDKLTDADLAAFDRKVHELLSPDQIDWLVRG